MSTLPTPDRTAANVRAVAESVRAGASARVRSSCVVRCVRGAHSVQGVRLVFCTECGLCVSQNSLRAFIGASCDCSVIPFIQVSGCCRLGGGGGCKQPCHAMPRWHSHSTMVLIVLICCQMENAFQQSTCTPTAIASTFVRGATFPVSHPPATRGSTQSCHFHRASGQQFACTW